ncbi:MAG: hypothetical protein AB8U25_00455 [Rickettsiales endosymbiont of Dermacentor nuttalli]
MIQLLIKYNAKLDTKTYPKAGFITPIEWSRTLNMKEDMYILLEKALKLEEIFKKIMWIK